VIMLHQSAGIEEIVRHLESVFPLLDYSPGHRAGDLREDPPDFLNRRYVLAFDLTGAVVDGLVIDEVPQRGLFAGTTPTPILMPEAADGFLSDGFLRWEFPALDFLADEFTQVAAERDVHRANPSWNRVSGPYHRAYRIGPSLAKAVGSSGVLG